MHLRAWSWLAQDLGITIWHIRPSVYIIKAINKLWFMLLRTKEIPHSPELFQLIVEKRCLQRSFCYLWNVALGSWSKGRKRDFFFYVKSISSFLSISHFKFPISAQFTHFHFVNFKRKWDFFSFFYHGWWFASLKFPNARGQSQSHALSVETVFISLVNSFRFAVTLPEKLNLTKSNQSWLRHFVQIFLYSFFIRLVRFLFSIALCIHQFSQSIGTKLWVLNLWLLFRFIIVVINVVVIFLIYY